MGSTSHSFDEAGKSGALKEPVLKGPQNLPPGEDLITLSMTNVQLQFVNSADTPISTVIVSPESHIERPYAADPPDTLSELTLYVGRVKVRVLRGCFRLRTRTVELEALAGSAFEVRSILDGTTAIGMQKRFGSVRWLNDRPNPLSTINEGENVRISPTGEVSYE